MDAVQFDPKTRQLTLVRAPVPTSPRSHEVVVKVAFAGICGTDLHIAEGAFPCRDRPVILGHEFSGVVTSVGADVRHLKAGDQVAVDPNSGCLNCDACHDGHYHYCTGGGLDKISGIFQDGGWAQFCVVPADQVHRLPLGMSLEQAGLAEPLSCISHGYDRIAPIPVGSRVLIQGAGIIGNLWAAVLHLQGHRKVVVSEPQASRRELIARLDTGYDIVSPEQLKARRDKDPDWGVDLVIDCSGHAPAIEQAVSLIRPGGKLCIFGVASPAAKISVSPYLLYQNELSIIAVKVNPFSFPKALGLMEAMGSRYLDYDNLGVKTFSLAQYQDALRALKDGSVAKAMFKMDA